MNISHLAGPLSLLHIIFVNIPVVIMFFTLIVLQTRVLKMKITVTYLKNKTTNKTGCCTFKTTFFKMHLFAIKKPNMDRSQILRQWYKTLDKLETYIQNDLHE